MRRQIIRILLVYPGFIVREVPIGLLSISATLVENGHETKIFELTHFLRNPGIFKADRKILIDFDRVIEDFSPDIIGFSAMTVGFNLTRKMGHLAKEKGKKVILGGIHPTVLPHQSIMEDFVDFIVVGEAEISFPEFLSRYDTGLEYNEIKGIWTKGEDGTIIENGISELPRDLDALPLPDRSKLNPAYFNAELTGANLLTSRGCPYHCKFCQNKYLNSIYRKQGPLIRYRAIDKVLSEIEELISKYDSSRFYFSDEMFTLNKKRTLDFCKAYQRRFPGYPFMCQTRADCIDEEIMEVLRDAGCNQINLAIESGSERIRNDILGKRISDGQIYNAFSLARKYNIKVQSFNMIGAPGETKDDIFETIAMNRKIKPDRILCTVYMPFHGTELGEECYRRGMVINNIEDASTYYAQVSIKNDSISCKDLIGYQGLFDWYVFFGNTIHKIWIDLVRKMYQILVSCKPLNNTLLNYIRNKIIELTYQSKRFLNISHVKNR